MTDDLQRQNMTKY